MRKYEFTFHSVNSENYSKPITVLVIEPDNLTPNTGIMHFTHGWGGNRFQHLDKMEYSVEKYNLICISTEYRQSGYDFDAITGVGADRPYDASFYQVFDVLNAFREVAKLYPKINRQRFFHYGGSQGGHIALLSSIFAPDTFAFVYSSSALVELTPEIVKWTGRDFMKHELSIRDVIQHAENIKCPLILEHGTADETVPCKHAEKLETRLNELGKRFKIKYYEGGRHDMQPAISKLDSYKTRADEYLIHSKNKSVDDFAKGSIVIIDCATLILEINWSQKSDSVDLFKWL